ncbi:MAG TPA: dihydropteroate synthase, partial [Acetobacterium sp.]
MLIGNRNFDLKNDIAIMGILNVTPDSFSDGGKFNSLDKSLQHVEKMINDGADIIDLGGESTRPGHKSVEESEEIDRVVPMIEAIRCRFDIPISIDTYKSKVGELAIQAGANLVNDVWGFKRDPR